MVKFTFILLFVNFFIFIQAQPKKNILNNSKSSFEITKNEPQQLNFNVLVPDISVSEIKTKEGIFCQLVLSDYINDGEIGNPALPSLKKLIEIPYGCSFDIKIISENEEVLNLSDRGIFTQIIPKQPWLRKDQDPLKQPFYKNQNIYSQDDFIEQPIVKVEEVGIMRGVKIGRLVINPIQYNPVQNQIKIYKNIKCEITFKNADLSLTERMKKKYYSPMFQNTFKMLTNYKQNNLKDAITTYPTKYLIISDRMFESALQPFIQWKTKKGFKVVVAYTDIIGNTETLIKSYISSLYNSGTPADPAPTYVLLVGDVAQVPPFQGSGHVTDLYYGEMDGGADVIPDIYYGRFSAQTVAQLEPQISKTLQYEQYTMPDPSFLQYSVMVAGVDGSNAPTYGNGQINYGVDNFFNNANGIVSHTYLYGSGSPITSDNPVAAATIHQNVSDGAGFVNYTAHCSSAGWADPSFSQSDVYALSNADKYCFMVGNCCQSSKFEEGECFGEAILRAPNKGAIGYIGASDYSYWDGDYYFSVGFKAITANPTYNASTLGFYDRMFHTNGEAETDWHISGGEIIFGGNLGVTQSGSSVQYYWEEYHLMGDPSLMPYLGVPLQLNPVNYQSTIPLGIPTVDISTEPYAYIGLTINNTFFDAKYTGSTGTATFDLSSIVSPCTLDVVITKQNRQPYFGTIAVIPNNNPYVAYQSNNIHDIGLDTNGIVEYSENVLLDITLRNVGNVNATNVNTTISSTNNDIAFTDSTENFGNINANTSVTNNNAYKFVVNNVIADQQNAQFTITSTDSASNSWQTSFNVMLNAPVLNVTDIIVDDSASGNNNGRLDPGETVTLKIVTTNTGHSFSPIAIGNLNLNNGSVTINNNSANLGNILQNNQVIGSFNITVDAGAMPGSVANFTYNVNANGYTASKTFSLSIGLLVEDFETNTFTNYPWDTTHYGIVPWIIINDGNVFEENYSARSGIITDNQTSDLTISVNVITSDTLSFYKKVSSEDTYDFLKFYIDGNVIAQWSGEVPWSREAYLLTAGSHILKWVYAKDYSVSNGLDAAFVDYITFPNIDIPLTASKNTNDNYYNIYPNPASNFFNLLVKTNHNENIKIEILNPVGQVVNFVTSQTSTLNGIHDFYINTDNLSKGIYFCKITTNNEIKILKVIIEK